MSDSRSPAAPDSLPPDHSLHAIVPAAGRGDRFGGPSPKQFVRIAGRPLVSWTIEKLLAAGCASIVVALPEESLAEARGLATDSRVRFVAGGSTRQASVAAALMESPAEPVDWVAVHDGARAAVAVEDFVATSRAAFEADGAVLGRSLSDTVKVLEDGQIVETLQRARLFRAETPQVFRRRTLERALDRARRDCFVGTDESALVERLGEVHIAAVEARHANPKLTYREDLAELERLLEVRLS